jgi:hypothetical protein
LPFSVFNEDNTIELYAEGFYHGDYEFTLEQSISQQSFVFDDGYTGTMLESSQGVHWITRESLHLIFDGDRSLLTDNEDLILRIARSLTSILPNEISEAPDVQPPTQAETAPSQSDPNIGWLHFDGLWEFNSEAIGYIIGNPMSVSRDRMLIVWDYQDFSLRFDESSRLTHIFSDNPSILSVGGVALNLNRGGLLAALGEPEHEGASGNGEFTMTYNMGIYSIQINMPSPNDVHNRVTAWRH